MMKIHLIWFFSIQILLHVSSSSSGKVPALIVFGDSSVDSGNNNFIPTIARSNFEPYGRDFPNGNPTGRFSNGRLAPDFISEAFGLKPIVPAYLDHSYDITDFATGVCFASAGTGFDNITASVADVIPLWKEVEYYKEYQNRLRAKFGNKKANEIINESLYLISIGTNDFLENYYQRLERRLQFSVQEYEDFLIGLTENFLREIYDLGARKISMTGLIPMGCLPLERAINILGHHGCKDLYREICLGDGGYVVCYEMAEIENKLGLGRDSLIALSLLLGSDYHQGVHGLGPELACQIVKSIGEKDVLKKFASEGLGWVKKRKGAKNNIGKDDTILQVIDAYLKPKCHSADSDFVLKAHSQYPFQRTKLHHICVVYFEWPSERTDGYILPCIVERDLRRFANLRSTSSELGLNLPLHEGLESPADGRRSSESSYRIGDNGTSWGTN
ncbi:unnamed protein product [Vicia faba]|uniref:GDSL esterase/lipase n=1 Tax=Vicia faba TaxID=3906 RepID=A0AAV0ZFA0_VICFA|nr:unnamed protein product [Vicia faba]